MAWLAIENGKEIIFGHDENNPDGKVHFISLPQGTIKKITGRDTIKEPVKLDYENTD